VLTVGKHQYRNCSSSAVTLEAGQDLEAIKRGKINIEQDQARPVCIGRTPPVAAVGDHAHSIPGPLKDKLELKRLAWAIFDQQNIVGVTHTTSWP
jgi:hypothetical protein